MQIVAVDYEKIHCSSFILIYLSAVHIINFHLQKVHNKYGHLDISEDKSVWNLPMNESPLEARRYIEVLINKVDRKSPNGSNASS
jgi:hypothetical protein